MKNIVILISGRGSNMEAIVDACSQEQWPARVAAVISNKATAAGLQFAASRGMATAVVDHQQFDSREAFDAELARVVDRYQPDVVVLAGFMRILTEGFVRHYDGRLLNIHPSPLGPLSRACARTNAPSRQGVSWPGPPCTWSRPSSTMAPS